MCWFPFSPSSRPRKYNHSSSSTSPLLGPCPARPRHHHNNSSSHTHPSSRHHYHPLSSHPPPTSETSLTQHYGHAGYRVRRLQPEGKGKGKGNTREREGVLSGHGVKRAPPRAWDEWDAAALQRRNQRLLRPSAQYHHSHSHTHALPHYNHLSYHHNAPATSSPHTTTIPSHRPRANSSARRARPLVHVGHNGSSFAARASAAHHAGLNDVLRAAMYQPDARFVTRPAAPVAGRRRREGGRGGGGGGYGGGGYTWGAGGGGGWGLESWM